MSHRTAAVTSTRHRRGFTLLETSIVVAVLAVLVAVAMPAFQSNDVERLRAAGDLLAGDLRLARSLAVRDASDYTLSLTTDGWKIEHTGLVDATHPAPDLPRPSFAGLGTGYEIDAGRLVGRTLQLTVRLVGTSDAADSVTFRPTGRTDAVPATNFWVSVGDGSEMRSLKVTVLSATGFVVIDEPCVGPPPSID